MDRLRQDLAFAFRLLYKDRAFAATTILTLAVCLGANAAIFTVVHSVLLRPLPHPEPHRLVVMYDGFPGAGVERAGTSIPNYFDRLAFTETLESQALYRFNGMRVGTGPTAEGVASMEVTPSFFRVLRTRAARGRLFGEDDGRVGRNHVVLLAQDFAARMPGGVDGIVGRELRLNDTPYTVVGIVPSGFLFLDPKVRLWTPLAFTPEQRGEDNRWSQNHQAIGRLAPGATVEQAQARMDALNARLLERAGSMRAALEGAGYLTRVVPLKADLVRNVRASLQLLWGGVLFVLLIAAVNLTNLSLVRTNGRMRELATRYALGAGGSRVIRQLVTETTVLTLAGGAFGIALGSWTVGALSSIGFSDLPRSAEIRVDAVVVAVIAAMAVVLGIVIGVVPALQIRNLNLNSVLRDEGRSGTAGRHSRSLGRMLVAAQVGLAFVLLVGAGLLLASFRQLLQVDPGFVAEHVLTGRLGLLESRYPNDAAVRAFADRALARIRSLPGVTAAGFTTALPFSWDDSSSVIIPEGYVPAPGESVVSPRSVTISPGYFETLRVPLKRGRVFTASDVDTAPRVIIVDEGARAAVLARRRPDRQAGVRAPAPGRRRQTRSRREVVHGRRRGRHDEDEGPRRRRGGRARRRLLLPVRAEREPRHRIRDPDERRSRGGRRGGAAGGRADRRRGPAVRRVQPARARRAVAHAAEDADAAVARVRAGRAAACGDRDLRRARVPGGAADSRDRHPHGARLRTVRRARPGVQRGRRAGARRAHGRDERGARAAAGDRRAVVRRAAARPRGPG